jgi:hypothetical protein
MNKASAPKAPRRIARNRQSTVDEATTSRMSRIAVMGSAWSSAWTAARTSDTRCSGARVVRTMNDPPLADGLCA